MTHMKKLVLVVAAVGGAHARPTANSLLLPRPETLTMTKVDGYTSERGVDENIDIIAAKPSVQVRRRLSVSLCLAVCTSMSRRAGAGSLFPAGLPYMTFFYDAAVVTVSQEFQHCTYINGKPRAESRESIVKLVRSFSHMV